MTLLPDCESTTVYELHTLQNGVWIHAAEAQNDKALLAAAERILTAQAEIGGFRIVRSTEFHGFDHREHVVLRKWIKSGSEEPDTENSSPVRDAASLVCEQPEDFYSEAARRQMRVFFARFIEQRRVVPLEFLHSQALAEEALGNRGIAQAAAQRAALLQAPLIKMPPNRRGFQLLEIADKALYRLRKECALHPVPEVGPGTFLAAAMEIAREHGDQFSFRLMRALVAYLDQCGSWSEKLSRLGLLIEPGLSLAVFRAIDELMAEIFLVPAALRELAGGAAATEDLVMSLIALYDGKLPVRDRSHAAGIEALAGMIAKGLAPRTRSALRLRLLEELRKPVWLRPADALSDEIDATNAVSARMAEANSPLSRDEELREAIERRAERAVTSDRLAMQLMRGRTAIERLTLLVDLILAVPGEGAKKALREQVREAVTLRAVLREATPATGRPSRADVIEPLAMVLKLFADGNLETSAMGRTLMQEFETEIMDALREEVVASKRPLTAKVDLLVRMYGKAPLPPGRPRHFVTEVLGRALQTPDFLTAYRQYITRSPDARDAWNRLQRVAQSLGVLEKAA